MPISNLSPPFTAACPCGTTRFRILTEPLGFVGCFCYSCQQDTGSPMPLKLQIEEENTELLDQSPQPISTTVPTSSGRGQTIWRCAKCYDGIWSDFGQPFVKSIKAGLLEPEVLRNVKPDVFVWTKRKADWIILDPKIPAYNDYPELSEMWGPEMWERAGPSMKKIAQYWKENNVPGGYGIGDEAKSKS